MSAELEDLRFGLNQIVDLKFLTNDKLQQVINNICDITGSKKNKSGLSLWIWWFHSYKQVIGGCHPNEKNKHNRQTSKKPKSWLVWNPTDHPFSAITLDITQLLLENGWFRWVWWQTWENSSNNWQKRQPPHSSCCIIGHISFPQLPPRHKSDQIAKQEEAEDRTGTWHRLTSESWIDISFGRGTQPFNNSIIIDLYCYHCMAEFHGQRPGNSDRWCSK